MGAPAIRGGIARGAGAWLLISSLVLVSAAMPAAAHAVAPPAPTAATVGLDSTENPDVLSTKGVAIEPDKQAALANSSVVYSVPVDDPGVGEGVRIFSSAYVSSCAAPDIKPNDGKSNPGSPCIRQFHYRGPFAARYEIKLAMHVYEADRPTEASTAATPLLDSASVKCDVDIHHCPLGSFADANLAGIASYVNVDLSAWRTGGKDPLDPRDRAEIEADCYQAGSASYRGCVPVPVNRGNPETRSARDRQSSKGQLSVVRYGSDYGEGGPHATLESSVVDRSVLPVASPRRTRDSAAVVSSFRFDDLAPGDLIEASAAAHLDGHNFDHDAGSWWVLATKPGRKRPLRIGSGPDPERYVSAVSGTNCLGSRGRINSRTNGSCEIAQAGALAVPAGAPPTMYLNYVVEAKDSKVRSADSDPTGPSAEVTAATFDLACEPVADATPEPCVIPLH